MNQELCPEVAIAIAITFAEFISKANTLTDSRKNNLRSIDGAILTGVREGLFKKAVRDFGNAINVIFQDHEPINSVQHITCKRKIN